MKLAIIMSGMLRNFDHTIFSTKKFVLEDNFFELKDIFFCGYSDTFSVKSSKEFFKKLYKPKKFKIEEWDQGIKEKIEIKTGCREWPYIKNHKANLTNVMSSWRCRFMANQLRKEYEEKNNIKYDLVYNLRCDLFFFDYIDHKLAIQAIKDSKSVYVPRDWDFKTVDKIAIGDIMAFGSSDAMDKYYSLYPNANKYRLKGVPGHPETILGNHFQIQNIKRKVCNRNVAREYPYTIPSHNHIWKNWSKKEVYQNLILKKQIEKKNKKRFQNKLSIFTSDLKKINLLGNIMKFIKK